MALSKHVKCISNESTPRQIPWASLVFWGAALLFVGYALRFFNYAEDDAFIPMRYARNFWHGDGWVMNPHERVEGCTSPLHLWYVTALMGWAGPDRALLFSKFLGLGVGVGVLWQTRRLGRLLWPGAVLAGDLAALLVGARPEFALSMINGLETGFATLLLTGAVAQWLRECRCDDHAGHGRSAFLFLGAALARPELTPAFPVLMAARLLARQGGRAGARPFALYTAALCLLETARLLFYGDVLPNTFYAKQLPPVQGWEWGLGYIATFALPGSLWLTLGVFVGGLWALRRHGGAGGWAVPTLLGMHTLFLLRCGGDWMMDGRFVMVVWPLAATLGAGAAWLAWHAVGTQGVRGKHGLAVAGGCALTACFAWTFANEMAGRAQFLVTVPGLQNVRYALAPHAPLQGWMSGNADGRLAVGRWIAGHAQPGQSVLYSEMGMATLQNPSVSFIDIRGLTDRKIARMRGYFRDRGGVQAERSWQDTSGPLGQYVRQRRPEWVVLLWDVYEPNEAGADRATGQYVPTGTFPVTLGGRVLTVATWRRRDVDVSRAPGGKVKDAAL